MLISIVDWLAVLAFALHVHDVDGHSDTRPAHLEALGLVASADVLRLQRLLDPAALLLDQVALLHELRYELEVLEAHEVDHFALDLFAPLVGQDDGEEVRTAVDSVEDARPALWGLQVAVEQELELVDLAGRNLREIHLFGGLGSRLLLCIFLEMICLLFFDSRATSRRTHDSVVLVTPLARLAFFLALFSFIVAGF